MTGGTLSELRLSKSTRQGQRELEEYSLRRANLGSKTSAYVWTAILLAAIVLLLLAWAKSYPLHQEPTYLPFLSSVYWTYWGSYLVFAISLWWIAITSHSVQVKWGAGVGFFTLINSLAYFYYYIPGPDTFFLNLVPAYLSGGFMNPQASGIYPWPGFFLLIHVLDEVTTLPLNITVSLYSFVIGFVIVSMVFFIATRHGFDGFWSVVTFSIIGFFFISYQFAPQTLALTFVMTLFCIDYAWGKSRGGKVTELTLVLAAAFSHSFMLIYYAVYRLVEALWNRRYIMGIFVITVGLVVNIFLTVSSSSFSDLTLRVFDSIQMMLGLSDYGKFEALVLTTGASPFQTFSRLSVLSAVVVSGLGLAGLIRSRKALSQDAALILTSTLTLGVGTAITLLGTRAIQLAIVVAAIGSGHFPELLHTRKVSVGLLLFLSISSIFPVLHANYQPLLYQSQADAQAASFLSAKIELGRGAPNPLRIFTPYILRGFFGLSDTGNASINIFFSFDEIDPTSMDYVLAPTATPAFSGSTYLAAKTNLTSRYNIIFNYGDGVIYAAI